MNLTMPAMGTEPPAGETSANVGTASHCSPITEAGFRKQFAMWGRKAEIAFPVNPHALRHACGYYLANKRVDTRRIQDYLGHKSIQSTVRYTQLSGTAFVGLFD